MILSRTSGNSSFNSARNIGRSWSIVASCKQYPECPSEFTIGSTNILYMPVRTVAPLKYVQTERLSNLTANLILSPARS